MKCYSNNNVSERRINYKTGEKYEYLCHSDSCTGTIIKIFFRIKLSATRTEMFAILKIQAKCFKISAANYSKISIEYLNDNYFQSINLISLYFNKL